MDKISIVTVVFNRKEEFEETIENILSQTYDNLELIIIDGGSTDGTVDVIKKYDYTIKVNENFSDVIKLCAKNRYRNSTWINNQIIDSYTKLSNAGKAISIEYFEKEKILGGLYGVILGEIFCGESMFSLKKNASKICIAHLAAHLIESGFKIIDTQFYSNHLSQFGTIEIPQEEYLNILNENNLKDDLSIKKNLKGNILEYF